MYYTGGNGYYTGQSGELEEAQVPQAGMGILPFILPALALAPLVPAVASMFMKKKKTPKGPTKAELEEQARQADEAHRANVLKYELIGGGILVAGVAAYFLLGKKGKK